MIINARSNGSLGIRNKPFKVLVCIVTLVAFLFNMISYDLAWAATLRRGQQSNNSLAQGGTEPSRSTRTPLEPTGVGSNRAGGPDSPGAIIKNLSVDTFTLPEYLGHVKGSWSASTLRRGLRENNGLAQGESPQKVVIHIQDAHCNYAAQHKISEILEYLNKEYGIDTINLEGGTKDYDLSTFTRISDKNIREKTADYFVKEGLVNGAEYFAINNPEKATLWGIEDTKLYLDNLNTYRDSLKYKDEVDKHLNALTHILTNLKAKIYSPELLELDNKYSQYKTGALEFKDYLSFLIQAAKDKAIDIKGFTNIYLLSQALAEEGSIDFKKANNQRDDLIDKLQKKLSKKSMEELVVKTVEFKSKKIAQKDFYAYLAKKANLVGIKLNDLPELQKYIVYISMYNAIDKMKVMDEMDRLENGIKDALYQNDKQKELNKLSKNLAIFKNIFNISLTKEDYKYYIDNEHSFNASNYASFINKEAPLYKITAQLDPSAGSGSIPGFYRGIDKNIADLDRYRENISKFYEYSFKRDDVFLKNIKFASSVIARAKPEASGLARLSAKPRAARQAISKIAVVVTGGFHTENLCEIFKKKNIAYISIMPAFKGSDEYECPYFRLLKGDEAAIEKMIYSAFTSLPSSLMAVASLSTALGKEVWGQGNIDAFKAWVGLKAIAVRDKWDMDKVTNISRRDSDSLEVALKNSPTPIVIDINDLLHQAGEVLDTQGAEGGRIVFAEHMKVQGKFYGRSSMRWGREVVIKNPLGALKFGRQIGGKTVAVKFNEKPLLVQGKPLEAIIERGISLSGDEVGQLIHEALALCKGADLKKWPTTSSGNPVLVIGLLDSSPRMFEDHIRNGFIGVNASINRITNSEIKKILLRVGVFHELSHELTGRNDRKFEREQMLRDVFFAAEIIRSEGINLVEICEQLSTVLAGERFVKEIIKQFTRKYLDSLRRNDLLRPAIMMIERQSVRKLIKPRIVSSQAARFDDRETASNSDAIAAMLVQRALNVRPFAEQDQKEALVQEISVQEAGEIDDADIHEISDESSVSQEEITPVKKGYWPELIERLKIERHWPKVNIDYFLFHAVIVFAAIFWHLVVEIPHQQAVLNNRETVGIVQDGNAQSSGGTSKGTESKEGAGADDQKGADGAGEAEKKESTQVVDEKMMPKAGETKEIKADLPSDWNSQDMQQDQSSKVAGTAPWSGREGSEVIQARIEGPFFGNPIKEIYFNFQDNGEILSSEKMAIKGVGKVLSRTKMFYRVNAAGVTKINPYFSTKAVIASVNIWPIDSEGNRISKEPVIAQVIDGRMVEFEYTGRVEVEVELANYEGVTFEYDQQPLPENELADFSPTIGMELIKQVREQLSPAGKAREFSQLVDKDGLSLREKLDLIQRAEFISGTIKLQAIANAMNKFCCYNGSYAMMNHNGKSWGSTWEAIIQSGERIRLICDSSSNMFALLAQRLGIPAGYVSIDPLKITSGFLIKGGIPHAMAIIETDGRWVLVETTGLCAVEAGLVNRGGTKRVYRGKFQPFQQGVGLDLKPTNIEDGFSLSVKDSGSLSVNAAPKGSDGSVAAEQVKQSETQRRAAEELAFLETMTDSAQKVTRLENVLNEIKSNNLNMQEISTAKIYYEALSMMLDIAEKNPRTVTPSLINLMEVMLKTRFPGSVRQPIYFNATHILDAVLSADEKLPNAAAAMEAFKEVLFSDNYPASEEVFAILNYSYGSNRRGRFFDAELAMIAGNILSQKGIRADNFSNVYYKSALLLRQIWAQGLQQDASMVLRAVIMKDGLDWVSYDESATQLAAIAPGDLGGLLLLEKISDAAFAASTDSLAQTEVRHKDEERSPQIVDALSSAVPRLVLILGSNADVEVRASAAGALENIAALSAAPLSTDAVDALAKTLLRDNPRPLRDKSYDNASSALASIAMNTTLGKYTIEAIEGALKAPNLDRYASAEAVRALGEITKFSPKLIQQSTVDLIEQTIESGSFVTFETIITINEHRPDLIKRTLVQKLAERARGPHPWFGYLYHEIVRSLSVTTSTHPELFAGEGRDALSFEVDRIKNAFISQVSELEETSAALNEIAISHPELVTVESLRAEENWILNAIEKGAERGFSKAIISNYLKTLDSLSSKSEFFGESSVRLLRMMIPDENIPESLEKAKIVSDREQLELVRKIMDSITKARPDLFTVDADAQREEPAGAVATQAPAVLSASDIENILRSRYDRPGLPEQAKLLAEKKLTTQEEVLTAYADFTKRSPGGFAAWGGGKRQQDTPQSQSAATAVGLRNPAPALFAEQVRKLDRDYGINEAPFLVTNEIDWKDPQSLKNIINQLAEPTKRGNLYLGFSGLLNFEIISARDPNVSIIMDYNSTMHTVYQCLQESMLASKDRYEFDRSFRVLLARRLPDYFRSSAPHVLSEELLNFQSLLNREGSWLSRDDSFKAMQERFKQNRIIFLRASLNDEELFEQLHSFMGTYDITLDSIYVSNILEFDQRDQAGTKIGELFDSNIGIVSRDNSFVIYADLLKPHLGSGLAQINIAQHKDFLRDRKEYWLRIKAIDALNKRSVGRSVIYDQSLERTELIRQGLAKFFGQMGTSIDKDDPEVAVLAERIFQARLANNAGTAMQVDFTGIAIGNIEKIGPAELRSLGMMGGVPELEGIALSATETAAVLGAGKRVEQSEQDDFAWQGGVDREQAERIIRNGQKNGVEVDLPIMAEQAIGEVLGPAVDSRGNRRYRIPVIFSVLDREMEGLSGPVRLRESKFKEAIVIGESFWEEVQSGNVRAIAQLAHEFMAGCVVSRNDNTPETINGEDAHGLARQVEKIILANAFNGQTPLLANVNEAKVDNPTSRALFGAIQRVSVMLRETKRWLKEYLSAEGVEKREMTEVDNEKQYGQGQELGDARMYRSYEVPSMRRKERASTRLFDQLGAYRGEVKKIQIYLDDIKSRLVDGEFEQEQVSIGDGKQQLQPIIQDQVILLERSLQQLGELQDETMYELSKYALTDRPSSSADQELAQQRAHDAGQLRMDGELYDEAMAQVNSLEAQDKERQAQRKEQKLPAPAEDYSYDGPRVSGKPVMISSADFAKAKRDNESGRVSMNPISLTPDGRAARLAAKQPAYDKEIIRGQPYEVINDGTPFGMGMGPCIGVVVYNSRTHKTYTVHAESENLDIIDQMFQALKSDPSMMDNPDDVSIVIAGAMVSPAEEIFGSEEALQDIADTLQEREYVVSLARDSGYKNIHTIFSGQVGVGVELEFDPDSGVCYPSLMLTERAIPLMIAEYSRELEQTQQHYQHSSSKEPKESGIALPVTVPVFAAVPAEDVKARQAAVAEAFVSTEGKDNDVKVVVGMPVDMNGAGVQPALSAINRGLAKNGFGRMEDNKQVITFEIDVNDPVKTAQNQERAMQKANEGLLPDGRVVLFAPQMESGPKLAGKAREQYKDQGNIIVVPDAYTDSAPSEEIFPDIMVRVALGRNIAFYYTGRDPQGTLAVINDLLARVADGQPPIVTIDDLLNLLKPLRIRPIVYEEIADWQRSQKAIATSL